MSSEGNLAARYPLCLGIRIWFPSPFPLGSQVEPEVQTFASGILMSYLVVSFELVEKKEVLSRCVLRVAKLLLQVDYVFEFLLMVVSLPKYLKCKNSAYSIF